MYILEFVTSTTFANSHIELQDAEGDAEVAPQPAEGTEETRTEDGREAGGAIADTREGEARS